MLRNEDAVSASGMGNVNEGPGTDEEAVEDEASGVAAGRGIGIGERWLSAKDTFCLSDGWGALDEGDDME